MCNKERKESGFTLIEILISMAILATGLLSLLALFPVGLDSAGRASNMSQAAILGMYQLDNIMQEYKYSYSGLSLLDGNSGTFAANPVFSWSISVTEIISGQLSQVTLTVSWTRRGVIEEEQFITYVANYK